MKTANERILGNDFAIIICKILRSIKAIAAQKNIDLEVYNDHSIKLFSGLPLEVQKAIIENFSSWEMVLAQLPLKKEKTEMDAASEVSVPPVSMFETQTLPLIAS